MFGVSGPTTSLCVVAAAEGTVVTSTDPFSGSAGAAGARKRRKRLRKRPRTIIAKVDNWRYRTAKRRLRVRFRFYSRTPTRGFLCRLDGRPLRRCKSPRHYWVTKGRHVFRVRAIGPTGLRGPFAIRRFRVHPPPKRRPVPLHPRPDSDSPDS